MIFHFVTLANIASGAWLHFSPFPISKNETIELLCPATISVRPFSIMMSPGSQDPQGGFDLLQDVERSWLDNYSGLPQPCGQYKRFCATETKCCIFVVDIQLYGDYLFVKVMREKKLAAFYF
jgi:hypothetical protein